MQNNIIKAILCDSQIFRKEYLFSNPNIYDKLLDILYNTRVNAYLLIQVDNEVKDIESFWKKVINEYKKSDKKNDFENIENILKILSDRGRIVYCPTPENYEGKELKEAREFDLIVSTKNFDTLEIEDIRELRYEGSIIFKQTKENFNKKLTSILAYAEQVQIVDPYFNLYPPQNDKKRASENEARYRNTLEIICEKLGNEHFRNDIKSEKKKIIIHTSVKSLAKKNKHEELDEEYLEKCKKYIKQLEEDENRHSIAITINVWEDLSDNKYDEDKKDRWHDRFLITNQCCISIGKGSDISKSTDATWGIVKWEEKAMIEKKFNPNNKYYKYRYRISSNEINKSPK